MKQGYEKFIKDCEEFSYNWAFGFWARFPIRIIRKIAFKIYWRNRPRKENYF
jgi:hypothetical protein